ncbi:uncharacterized protein [Channa argus]|uniref:uncharacterized protein n=1 Tax=Channa argus TaxID=215402 RepID=UPI003520604E
MREFSLTGVSCENLTAVNNEEFTLESSNVTLSYKYSRQADARDFFFWYQQHSGKPPQFLISHSASGVGPLFCQASQSSTNSWRHNVKDEYTFSDTVFTMLSLHCLLSIQFLLILTGVSCDKLNPIKKEEFSLEGSNITLTYKYSKAAVYTDYFFWYRQYPGKPPQFLISHSGTEPNKTAKDSGLSVKMSEDKTQVDLQISSAAVSDSAVYYCAVRPTSHYSLDSELLLNSQTYVTPESMGNYTEELSTCFHSACKTVLDVVAPLKTRQPKAKPEAWLNAETRAVRR